jgi:CRP/FNR family transcriptional regulator, cyclic AMP receptor protein
MSAAAARGAPDSAYDPRVALEFFKAAGKAQRISQGATIFSEKEEKGLFKRGKVYLLLSGEVALLAGAKTIGAVRPGEIFGELAAITQAPRSATAVAAAECKVIALDDKEFQAALRKKPGFALMLMSVMIRRLRETIQALEASGTLSPDTVAKEAAVFDAKHLAKLVGGLSDDPPVYFDRNKPIMLAGQTGLRMYVVTEGRVAVTIGEQVVERLGPGGVFGEAALVDQSTRLASAVAETDCALLPIGRNAFLALVKMSPGFAESLLSSLAGRLRFLTSRAK